MQKQQTIIHFVRHGQVCNPESVRYGRLPGFHLDEAGRRQMEQTSLFFIKRPITHIYSSPLERTQQSATLLGIAFPQTTITLDARLIETKTAAKFEGKTRDAAFYLALRPTTDAETGEQIIERLLHFSEEKIIAHHGKEIIAVSHGDPIALLYNYLSYGPSAAFRGVYPTYGSIYSFVYYGASLKEVWYWAEKVNGLPATDDSRVR